ncbi:hypothetical protein AVEN_91385-1 [Araneus ventricosus]|uniref:Uncharacterized protein n=1 Tax=Araneus ventricosus TaxID=182803 RepID=A0A4Y2S7M1_ARAVE|nr:hypothetical protein AVEN_91385-1 [Araneus ventricosus]
MRDTPREVRLWCLISGWRSFFRLPGHVLYCCEKSDIWSPSVISITLIRMCRQHTIFNGHSKIQVGGKFNSVKNRIERPFQGVISGLVFGGNRILDMAAEDDPRVSLQGDVELLIAMPPGGQTVDSAENSEEVSQ